MRRKFLFLLVLIAFCSRCIAQAPNRPDPPYAMLKYFFPDPSSASSETTNPITQTPTLNLGTISDTGQTQCWTTGGALLACAGTGQDGEFLNTPRGRSFSGPTQHPQYTADYTTLDNVSGLTWKSCPQGQSGPTCTAGAAINITWNAATAGGPGSCSDLNNQNGGNGYAGKTNWRIPTLKELLLLYNYSNTPAHIETAHFPNGDQSNLYLSNTDYPLITTMVWVVDFLNSSLPTQTFVKSAQGFLYCVSGNPPPFSFQSNGNGTVTDLNTNLLWSKCAGGMSGTTCSTGILGVGNYSSALTYCNGLAFAGRSDWRLPNANELMSVVDYAAGGNPAIPIGSFPNFSANPFWTSTTDETTPNTNLQINFNGGFLTTSLKAGTGRRLCVTSVQ